MVILSAAITSKSGKALMARQFVELNKVRIEGLLAAFPKLMGTDKEHTFIETESVRYVYQPLESLYILLVTNKSSNIMEDLETLHLLAKIVPEYCHALDEKDILKYAFDLIFAFDEVIAMGYKERVNLQQVKHFLAMESADEQRAKQEEKNKMAAAKKAAEKKRKELEKKRLEEKARGIGSSSMSSSSSYSPTPSKQSYVQEPVVESRKESPKPQQDSRIGKGMQLGKKGPKGTDYAKVLQEENIPDVSSAPSTKGSSTAPELENITSNTKLHTSIVEKLTVVAENDGALKTFQIKGELALSVFDPAFVRIKVHLSQGTNDGFQFMTHPFMNKTLFSSDNVLALKEPGKAYPTVTPTGILKWRYQTNDEKMIPLSINVWPSTSSGETTVPIQFEKHCDFDLHDVTISVPIPGNAGPIINEIVGSSEYDSKKGILHWKIPLIHKGNSNGNMEFTVPSSSASSFFPVRVSFKSNTTFCAIQVVSTTDEKDQSVDFTQDTSLGVDQYDIE